MDLKTLAEKVDLEEAEYQEIFALFLKTTSQHLDQLDLAIETGNSGKVVELAHSIKGSAASLGLAGISEVAREMEADARKDNLKDAEGAVQTIKVKMERMAELVPAHSITG